MTIKAFWYRVLGLIAVIGLSIFGVLCGIAFYLDSLDADSPPKEPTTWTWEQEDCFLVDVRVDEENQTVEMLYSLRFVNHSDKTYQLAPVSATFSWIDLMGWMEYDNWLWGERLDGEYYTYLPPHETVDVVFVFKGKYLGGRVKEEIAPPGQIMTMIY